MDAGAVPALVLVVLRNLCVAHIDQLDACVQAGIEEERKRKPPAPRNVPDPWGVDWYSPRVRRSSMSPMLHTNESGTGGASIH